MRELMNSCTPEKFIQAAEGHLHPEGREEQSQKEILKRPDPPDYLQVVWERREAYPCKEGAMDIEFIANCGESLTRKVRNIMYVNEAKRKHHESENRNSNSTDGLRTLRTMAG